MGAGAAGLVTAWLVQTEHDIVVLEASGVPGGHVETAPVVVDGRTVDVDLGAQFFFREGYSGLHALIARLGLVATPARLGVSVNQRDGGTIVLPPRSRASLRPALSRAVLRRLHWFLRFGLGGEALVRAGDWSVTVQGLLDRLDAPRDVADDFVVPFVASSWGVPDEVARELSAYSVTRVMGVRPTRLPHTHTLPGGLSAYVRALVADAPGVDVRLDSPARGLRHLPDGGLEVHTDTTRERFDAVVLACDWRTSATLCGESAALSGWHHAFSAFEDYDTTIVAHREPTWMPPDRRLWQIANHDLTRGLQPRNTVWAGLPLGADVFRSWLRPGEAEPPTTLHVRRYKHILMTTKHRDRQRALARLQGRHGVWAAGMYTDGIDNHESAIRSAVTVGRALAPESARVRWLAARVSE